VAKGKGATIAKAKAKARAKVKVTRAITGGLQRLSMQCRDNQEMVMEVYRDRIDSTLKIERNIGMRS